MNSAKLEKTISIILSVGVAATILVVTTFMSIEPVNTPKMLILAVCGIASWAFILSPNGFKDLWKSQKLFFIAVFLFVFFLFTNLLTSPSPVVLTFYGFFGRATGVLTYFSLAGIALIVSVFKSKKSHQRFVYLILTAGLINLIYCGIDIIGPDILGWNNNYGEILGTLGNPDFISAFLGIVSAMAFPIIFSASVKMPIKIALVTFEFVALWEILESQAKQGLVVFVLGLALGFFFVIKSRTSLKNFLYPYSIFSIIVGIFALLGVLQKGPLVAFLYKTSVSLRGVYWNTGLAMGQANPLTGVGLDAYGDYYREFRDAQAIIQPGPGVVTNAAHNVIIDIFAGGGYPLLVSYLLVLAIGSISIFRIVRKSSSYDHIGAALIAGWLAYQVQSIISINQIGLAICGWLMTGLLVSYAKIVSLDSETINDKMKSRTEASTQSLFPFAIGAVVGLCVALPPFLVDAQWRSALHRGDGNAIIKVATKWPKDTYRLTNIAFALEKSNLPDDAILIARENIRFNPRSYDAWKLLVQLSKSTPEEKNRGVKMLHKLDPLNPEFK